MKNQRGITLIALVVTIVVLLILAGTSIAMLGGENGIITHAQDAAVANIEGEAIDKMDIAYNTVKAYVITKSSTLSDWTANSTEKTPKTDEEASGEKTSWTGPSTELTVANVILKEILPNEDFTDTDKEATGDGYTIKYTSTEGETAGKVEITYSDKTFNGTLDDKHYKEIKATITISSDDVEYTRPERQVNQK